MRKTFKMKTKIIKSINSNNIYYIFRDNGQEVEVKINQNEVFSNLELTTQEKKDILLLIKYDDLIFNVIKNHRTENALIQWHKDNHNYK